MLRKNATKEENHLWYDFLKNYPIRFTRQKVLGKYIADFYCAQAKLVVELDGKQHYTEVGLEKDIDRTEYLKTFGIKVLRFTNGQVLYHFKRVCDNIDQEIGKILGQQE